LSYIVVQLVQRLCGPFSAASKGRLNASFYFFAVSLTTGYASGSGLTTQKMTPFSHGFDATSHTALSPFGPKPKTID
jgi:hypothetical protein